MLPMLYDIAKCKRQLRSQATVAATARLSQTLVSRFFRGESVSVRAAMAIIAACGLRYRDVVIRQDEREGKGRRSA